MRPSAPSRATRALPSVRGQPSSIAVASGRAPKVRADGSTFGGGAASSPAPGADASRPTCPSGLTSHHCSCFASSSPPTAMPSLMATASAGSMGSASGRQVEPASRVSIAPRMSAIATARHASSAAMRPCMGVRGSGPRSRRAPCCGSSAMSTPVTERTYIRSRPICTCPMGPAIVSSGSARPSHVSARHSRVSIAKRYPPPMRSGTSTTVDGAAGSRSPAAAMAPSGQVITRSPATIASVPPAGPSPHPRPSLIPPAGCAPPSPVTSSGARTPLTRSPRSGAATRTPACDPAHPTAATTATVHERLSRRTP